MSINEIPSEEEFEKLSLEDAKKVVEDMIRQLPDEALPEVYEEIKKLTGDDIAE